MALQTPITGSDGLFVGEDKVLNFTIYEEDNVTPQDITGWEITFSMRQKANEGPLVFSQVATLLVPASGTCSITFASADTTYLPSGTYAYALRRTDTGSNTVLAYGSVELTAAPPLPA